MITFYRLLATILTLFFATFLGQTCFISSSLFAQSPVALLETSAPGNRSEKVYVSHDKPSYAPGDTIWATVFVVDGQQHQLFAGTPLIYVDWINPAGQLMRRWTLQSQEGTAELDIPTSTKDTTGNYVLRVYTNYQLNFDPAYRFQKEIRLLNFRGEASVTSTDAGLLMDFFPEGGHLVAGLDNRVAFLARTPGGKNREVTGTLITEAGRKVGNLLTLNDGMGVFSLHPEAGERYFARINDGGEVMDFPLPEALPTGYVLHASSRSREQLKLELSTNLAGGLAGARVVGHLRGMPFLDQLLGEEASQLLLLQKAELPTGVLHFTLFSPAGKPLCERLLFNKNPEESVVAVLETEGESYAGREAVDLHCAPKLGASGRPACFTVSVFAADLADATGSKLNFRNYLLLQSDLRGRVNNPAQYFLEDGPRTSTLLDLLLMTHGWRKFNWLDVLAGTTPAVTFLPEEHLSFAGYVSRYGKKGGVQADVSLNILSAANFVAQQLTTGEDGRFVFPGLDLRDTTDILLQASTHNARQQAKLGEDELRRTGSRYVDIHPVLPDTPAYRPALSFPSVSQLSANLRRYAYEVATERAATAAVDADLSVELETVTVTTGLNKAQLREQEIENRYDEKGVFYFGGTTKFRADDPQFEGFNKDNIFRLIALIVPRAHYVAQGGLPGLRYGSPVNGVEPIYVLDGQVIRGLTLQNLDPNSIAVIDLLEGEMARLYSDDGMVIQLVSKRPEEIEVVNPGMLNYSHPGYYQARSFYAPDYDGKTELPAGTDFRTTLFWSGAVRTDAAGADFRFFTGDRPGSYLIRMEGITVEGLPFYGERVIGVK